MNITVAELVDLYIDSCFTVAIYGLESDSILWAGMAYDIDSAEEYVDAEVMSIDVPGNKPVLTVNIDF